MQVRHIGPFANIRKWILNFLSTCFLFQIGSSNCILLLLAHRVLCVRLVLPLGSRVFPVVLNCCGEETPCIYVFMKRRTSYLQAALWIIIHLQCMYETAPNCNCNQTYFMKLTFFLLSSSIFLVASVEGVLSL